MIQTGQKKSGFFIFFRDKLPKMNFFLLLICMEKNKKACKNKTSFPRLLFTILLFSCVMPAMFCEEAFNFAEFKFASTLTLPAEAAKKKSASGNAGLRLSFKDADIRGFLTLKKTEFQTISDTDGLPEKIALLDDIRLGAGLSLFRKTVPISVKIGQNSFSRSVSRLKNPNPSSSANPLVKAFAFSTGIGAALPTLTSGSQPLSCAVSAFTGENLLPLQLSAECFATEDRDTAATIALKRCLSRSVLLQSAFSLGRFYIENNSKVLEKNNAAFDSAFFRCALAEFCIQSPLVKCALYSGFHENPYENTVWWFKTDWRTSLGFLMLNASYFAVPGSKKSPRVAPLIGASSSICRTVEQASVNPQILLLFDDKSASSIRAGFSALENWKVTSTNTPVQLNTMKVRGAVAYESRFYSLCLDWAHANILLEGEPPTKSSAPEEYYSYSFSSSFAGNHAKLSSSSSYMRYTRYDSSDKLKEVYSTDIKIALPQWGMTLQGGIGMTFKDGERTAGQVDASIAYSLKRKYIRSSLKVGLALPF